MCHRRPRRPPPQIHLRTPNRQCPPSLKHAHPPRNPHEPQRSIWRLRACSRVSSPHTKQPGKRSRTPTAAPHPTRLTLPLPPTTHNPQPTTHNPQPEGPRNHTATARRTLDLLGFPASLLRRRPRPPRHPARRRRGFPPRNYPSCRPPLATLHLHLARKQPLPQPALPANPRPHPLSPQRKRHRHPRPGPRRRHGLRRRTPRPRYVPRPNPHHRLSQSSSSYPLLFVIPAENLRLPLMPQAHPPLCLSFPQRICFCLPSHITSAPTRPHPVPPARPTR